MPPDGESVSVLPLVAVLRDAGLVTLLLGVLLGGWKQWWVWGWQLADLRAAFERQLADERAEKQEWKTLALRNLDVAKTLLRHHDPPTGELKRE